MHSYTLPPEWSAQSGVMLTWPHSQSDWQPFLKRIEPIYIEIAREISKREKLIICCYDRIHESYIKNLIKINSIVLENCFFYVVESNDSWSRDHGPITVYDKSNKPVILDMTFNAWGNKFESSKDNLINKKLQEGGAFRQNNFVKIDFVLEGGSIETNGTGSLLTTKKCVLSKTRNPNVSQQEIETLFQRLFGVSQVLWLEHGSLEGDDTDGHIDTLARFTDEKTICYVYCDDPQDSHYEEIQKMSEELQRFRDLDNQPFRLVPLPWPQKKTNAKGHRLPVTYANFLIVNKAVLVPQYSDPMDVKALSILKDLFPNREVIGINCEGLLQQYGSLHCITMQIPEGVF